jgi:hypothetical protein
MPMPRASQAKGGRVEDHARIFQQRQQPCPFGWPHGQRGEGIADGDDHQGEERLGEGQYRQGMGM